MTLQEIANKYNVTIYCISDINRGKSFHDDTIKYPLRPSPQKSEIDDNKINIILDMIINTSMAWKEIALATNTNEYTIGAINNGKNSWCPSDLKYPLRKPNQKNTFNNKINE